MGKVLSFLTPQSIEAQVGGETLKFFPISAPLLFTLQGFAKPFAQSLTALFTGVGHTRNHIERVKGDGDNYEKETIDSSSDPKLAELRLASRTKAIGDLCLALTDPSNKEILGKIIMDSLREQFTVRPIQAQAAKEFMDQVDVVALKQLLMGVGEANKAVLGPLGHRLSEEILGSPLDTQPTGQSYSIPKSPGSHPASVAVESAPPPASETPELQPSL